MLIPADTDAFLDLLSRHFGFSSLKDGQSVFTTLSDYNPREHSVVVPDNPNPYKVHFSKSPYSAAVISHHDNLCIHAFITQTQQDMTCIPLSRFPGDPLHRHTALELFYVLDGPIDFVIEQMTTTYQKGDFCLLNTDTRHREKSLDGYTILYLGIEEKHLQHLLTNDSLFKKLDDTSASPGACLKFSPAHSLSDADQTNIQQLLFQIVLEILYRQPNYENVTEQLICRLFSYIKSPKHYNCSQIQSDCVPQQSIVEQILLYLHEHPYRIKYEELSKYIGYAPSYLNRIFTEYAGQSIADYNRKIYLAEAARLLKDSSMSVSAVCETLHFESRSAFYAQFQKKYGMTPKEYKRHSSDNHEKPNVDQDDEKRI